MKCLVCGNENVDKRSGECPDCGFELIGWTGSGDQEEYMEIVKEMVEDYRRDYRKTISVALLVPTYESDEGGTLTMKSEDPIVLAGETPAESVGEVKWYPERFARLDAGEALKLQLSISSANNGGLKKEVEMTAPDWGSVFWKIGILEEDNLHFRLVLGAEGDDSKRLDSDSISMVGSV